MFNMHKELNEFYEDHVRLGKERQTLAKHRDTNLNRLKAGLAALAYPSSFDHRDQGSYAMYTINQHPDKDYDIDVAVIFSKEYLPGSAWRARKRIEEAMQKGGGNFSQPPEAKTNAVRVYYAEGHHVDLAIYRRYENEHGVQIHEHAGSDWTSRDPMTITNWFNATVREVSPTKEQEAAVSENQMRRVVRWLKAFAKSRKHWSMPGGLLISVLVAECYRPDYHRDDVSLYDTVVSIRNRLQDNEDVANPVDSTQLLTSRHKDIVRIRRFKEKLDSAISELRVLHSPESSEEEALEAWYWFFQHPFWGTEDRAAKKMNEYGKSLGKAAREGSVFVTTAGRVATKAPEERHIKAPPNRFYGSS